MPLLFGVNIVPMQSFAISNDYLDSSETTCGHSDLYCFSSANSVSRVVNDNSDSTSQSTSQSSTSELTPTPESSQINNEKEELKTETNTQKDDPVNSKTPNITLNMFNYKYLRTGDVTSNGGDGTANGGDGTSAAEGGSIPAGIAPSNENNPISAGTAGGADSGNGAGGTGGDGSGGNGGEGQSGDAIG